MLDGTLRLLHPIMPFITETVWQRLPRRSDPSPSIMTAAWPERVPDAAMYPGATPEMLVAGSVVFRQPPGRVPMNTHYAWWDWLPGADWRHPEGPDSIAEATRIGLLCRPDDQGRGQIAARELALPAEGITVTMGDTAIVPFDSSTSASR